MIGPIFHDYRQAAQAYLETNGLPKRKFEDWKHSLIQTFVQPTAFEHSLNTDNPSHRPTFLNVSHSLLLGTQGLIEPYTSTHAPNIHYTLLTDHHEQAALLKNYPIDYQHHPLAAMVYSQTSQGHQFEIAPDTQTSIHLIHQLPVSDTPASTHRWKFIQVGARSQILLIENCHAHSSHVLFNQITLIHLQEGATLHYIRLSPPSQNHSSIQGLHVWQAAHSQTKIHYLQLGSSERHDLDIHLQGEKAHTSTHHTLLTQGNAHQDHHVRIHHLAPLSQSTVNMRAITSDRAHSVTHAKVIIPAHSHHCEATQQLHHLLLSPTATAALEPQLEIDTDQVRCTHGANVGQLDELALHYCISRGIPLETAKQMLSQAFLAQCFTEIPDPWIQKYLDSLLNETLVIYFGKKHHEPS